MPPSAGQQDADVSYTARYDPSCMHVPASFVGGAELTCMAYHGAGSSLTAAFPGVLLCVPVMQDDDSVIHEFALFQLLEQLLIFLLFVGHVDEW